MSGVITSVSNILLIENAYANGWIDKNQAQTIVNYILSNAEDVKEVMNKTKKQLSKMGITSFTITL